MGAICGALGKILEYVIDDLIKYRKIYPKKIKWGKVVVAAVFGAASGAWL